MLSQDTVNFVAELAVARDNQSTILSGSPRENSEELPIGIQQVSDNTVGETTEQHTSFWPKVLPLVSGLPIGLTVAHWSLLSIGLTHCIKAEFQISSYPTAPYSSFDVLSQHQEASDH